MVINVNTAKTIVTSACYDKQHVYAYLQLFYAGTADSDTRNLSQCSWDAQKPIAVPAHRQSPIAVLTGPGVE